jgi:hypothetical protein
LQNLSESGKPVKKSTRRILHLIAVRIPVSVRIIDAALGHTLGFFPRLTAIPFATRSSAARALVRYSMTSVRVRIVSAMFLDASTSRIQSAIPFAIRSFGAWTLPRDVQTIIVFWINWKTARSKGEQQKVSKHGCFLSMKKAKFK